MTNMKEMKCLELMDEVTFSVINEFAGRNESERSSSLEMDETQWPSSWIPGEGNMLVRTVTNRRTAHWRGGSDDMQTRIWFANGETLLTPLRNQRKQGKRYNRTNGKCADGERESDGVIVAKKSGNLDGAKYPCCKIISSSKSEARLT